MENMLEDVLDQTTESGKLQWVIRVLDHPEY